MIILDTHIWVWWESDSSRLTRPYREILNNADEQFAVSIISCWEVAKASAMDAWTLIGPSAHGSNRRSRDPDSNYSR